MANEDADVPQQKQGLGETQETIISTTKGSESVKKAVLDSVAEVIEKN